MRKILQSSLLLLVALVCLPAAGQAAGKASYSSSTERSVLALLNDIRHEHGLSSFVASTALRECRARALRGHAQARLLRAQRPDARRSTSASAATSRARSSARTSPGAPASYASAEGIVRLWMHSPPHRHIILMPTLHRVGLGVATGSFQGNPGAMMATADFSS